MNQTILFVVIVAILSTARTARLLVWDKYPPVVWLRARWDAHVTSGWNKLLHCAFCLTPYIAFGMAVWVALVQPDLSDLWDYWSAGWWWWAINATWGLSYAAAITVAWDQPAGD